MNLVNRSPFAAERALVLDEAGAETLALAPQHLRAVQVALMDQTDNHNELVWEREWLLMPNQRHGLVLVAGAQASGKTTYRLRVGPFSTREAAQAAQARIRALGDYKDAFITAK